jgi:hypothetical protein
MLEITLRDGTVINSLEMAEKIKNEGKLGRLAILNPQTKIRDAMGCIFDIQNVIKVSDDFDVENPSTPEGLLNATYKFKYGVSLLEDNDDFGRDSTPEQLAQYISNKLKRL